MPGINWRISPYNWRCCPTLVLSEKMIFVMNKTGKKIT
jgi:hypothetical protein